MNKSISQEQLQGFKYRVTEEVLKIERQYGVNTGIVQSLKHRNNIESVLIAFDIVTKFKSDVDKILSLSEDILNYINNRGLKVKSSEWQIDVAEQLRELRNSIGLKSLITLYIKYNFDYSVIERYLQTIELKALNNINNLLRLDGNSLECGRRPIIQNSETITIPLSNQMLDILLSTGKVSGLI